MTLVITPATFTTDEQAEKLEIIATLTVHELEGYQDEARRRGYFPGEAAALAMRRGKL